MNLHVRALQLFFIALLVNTAHAAGVSAGARLFELESIQFRGNAVVKNAEATIALRARDIVDIYDIKESAAALRKQGVDVHTQLNLGSRGRHVLVFTLSKKPTTVAAIVAKDSPKPVAKSLVAIRQYGKSPTKQTKVAVTLPVVVNPSRTPSNEPSPSKVASITFVGNDITRPYTMLRELNFSQGSQVTSENLVEGKQALLNLGLFSSVKLATNYGNDEVQVTYQVAEKTYLLPIPRLSVNSSGETSAGLKVRWSNLWGRNHTFDATIKRKRLADADKGDQDSLKIRYKAPNIAQSDINLGLSYSASETPITPIVGPEYLQRSERASVSVGRRLDEKHSRRWFGSGTIGWWKFNSLDDDTQLVEAHSVPYLGAAVRFDGSDTKLYSEVGNEAEVGVEASLPGGSFDYVLLSGEYRHFIDPTPIAHDNLILRTEVGAMFGRPNSGYNAFSLNNDQLRGYEKGLFEGQAYYSASAEYLLPVFGVRSLRALVFADLAETHDEWDDFCFCNPKLSVGFGLRWRPQWFVGLELTLGLAYAIDSADVRAFGGSGKFR